MPPGAAAAGGSVADAFQSIGGEAKKAAKDIKSFFNAFEGDRVVKFERGMYALSLQMQISSDRVKSLSKDLREMAKGSTYSSQEMLEMTKTFTNSSQKIDVSNKVMSKFIDTMTRKFPIGAGAAIKALSQLGKKFNDVEKDIIKGNITTGQSLDALISRGASFEEMQTAIIAQEGAPGGGKDLLGVTIPKQQAKVSKEEAMLTFGTQFQDATIMFDTAVKAFYEATGNWGVGSTKILSGLTSMASSPLGTIFGLKMAGAFGGGGGAAATAATGGGGAMSAAGGMLNILKALPGKIAGALSSGVAGPLALGAAATGAGIYGVSKLANSQGASADNYIKGQGRDPKLVKQSYAEMKAAGTEIQAIEKGINSEHTKRAALISESLKTYSAIIKVREMQIKIGDDRISQLDAVGANELTHIGIIREQITLAKDLVKTTGEDLKLIEDSFKREQKRLKEKLKSVQATGSEKDVMEARRAIEENSEKYLEKKSAHLQAHVSLAQKEWSEIQKQYSGKMKLLDANASIVESNKSIAKSTYMPPSSQVEYTLQGIDIKQQKLETERNLREQILKKQREELAVAKGAAAQAAVKAKYGQQLLDNMSNQRKVQAEIASDADYIRRTWMETFTATMMGADSGSYLMPGASQLSGMQEKGAAFMPFAGDANGGGHGTYKDVYGKFDPALTQSRTIAERDIADKVSSGTKRIMEKYNKMLERKIDRSLTGQ